MRDPTSPSKSAAARWVSLRSTQPTLALPLLLRRLAEAVVERVAGAAHGADRIDVVAAIERLAQPADMDVDGALVDVDFAAPDPVEQLLAREHAAGSLHQELEQAIFGRPEIDRAAGARDALLLAVDLEVAEGQHVGDPFGPRAAQQRPDARAQLRNRERLDDVVVGAGCQPAHALALLAARGQHDDRQLLGLGTRAQPPAELDAGQAGQHPIQNDE